MVSKAEWCAAKRDHLRYLPHQWKHVAINTYPWNTKIGPWDAGFDVYGDGSVVTVALPGHSYGLTATIIRSSNISSSDPARWVPNASGDGVHDGREFILLTSDARLWAPLPRRGSTSRRGYQGRLGAPFPGLDSSGV